MISIVNERMVQVMLPESKAYVLLERLSDLCNEIAGILKAPPHEEVASKSSDWANPPAAAQKPEAKTYAANFLGEDVHAWTLPEIFAQVVDLTAHVAPEALDKLAALSARTRRFVAMSREAIHPDNPNLPTMKTKSGWWISKNIGQEDLKRALWYLAYAAGLEYGRDVVFRVNR